MARFDVKRVTPLEWAGVGAGALAFIVSFFPWYSFSWDGGDELLGFSTSGSLSAWNSGIGAWLPVLLLMVAAGLVLAPHFGTQVPRQVLIWVSLSAAAVVIILLRWLTLPDDGGLGGFADAGFSSGAGAGLIIGLVAALVSAAAAVLSLRGSRAHTIAGPGPVAGSA